MIDLVKTNPALAQEMLAAVTGIPVDAVGATFGQMAQVVRDVQASSTAAEFHRVCPDFSDSPQDVEKLLGVMSELGLPQTVQGLELGHSYCLRKGVYQPLTQTQQQAATPGRKLPAPIPDGSASQPTGEPNAWTMPKDQLKALLERGQ